MPDVRGPVVAQYRVMPNHDRRGHTMLSTASYVAAEQLADRRADAIAFHAASQAAATVAPREDVVLRRSTAQDAVALARLAQLDGAPRPVGAVLVAELDGEIVAAVPVEG